MRSSSDSLIIRGTFLRAFALILVFLLTAYVILQIALNPDVDFLPPSMSTADWMLAPIGIANTGGRETEAIFTQEINISADSGPISSALIHITADRTYEIRVNGHVLYAQPTSPAHNWKVPRTFSVINGLHAGTNLLEILVRNTVRPPALLVHGAVSVGSHESIPIDSGNAWHVRSTPGSQQSAPEGMPPPREFYPGHYLKRLEDPGGTRRLELLATLMAYLVITSAIFLYFRAGRIEKDNVRTTVASKDRLRSVFKNSVFAKWMFALLLIALYFPMAVIRAPTEGWDADGHIEHLRYVAAGRGVPMANEGWEMYQPPAYYWLASAVYRAVLPVSIRFANRGDLPSADFLSLKAVQVLTPLFAILQFVIVLQLLHHVFPPPHRLSPLTIALVALLPMRIYFSSFISNEMFSSVAISAGIYILVANMRAKRFEIGRSALLGFAIGFACLSKYSGLLLVMTACFVYAVFFVMRVENRRRLIVSFLTVSVVVLCLCVPYYARNIRTYGRLLPLNLDFVQQFTIEYFDWRFLVDPTRIGLGAVDKFVSRASSFIDGNYSSMWLDNSHIPHSWTGGFEVPIYYLAFFPTVLIVAGFCRALYHSRSDSENGRSYFTVVTIFIFAWFSYVYFVLRFGSFEVVKAFYLLSQVGPAAVFFELGRKPTGNHDTGSSLITTLIIVLYALIAVYYFLTPILIGKGL